MDIAGLRIFLAVAESGSFSRAGDLVHLTQPAISKRIAALESELGSPLFDRVGRQILLTEAGRALLPRARAIVSQTEDAARLISNLSGQVGGRLGMATSHHIGLHRLPPALAAFHARFPQVKFDLRFMGSESACQAVAHGQLELAVVTLPQEAADELRVTRVWHDPLDIVIGRDHALARTDIISATQLAGYPAILPGAGTVTRELVVSTFRRQGVAVDIGMTTNYLEVLKMLAAIGFGWSALPRTMIDGDLKVVHIENVRIQRELGIVTHRSRTLSNAAQAMIQTITEHA